MKSCLSVIVLVVLIYFLVRNSDGTRPPITLVYCQNYEVYNIKNFKFITLYGATGLKKDTQFCMEIDARGFDEAFKDYEESCRRGLMDGDFSTSFNPSTISGVAKISVRTVKSDGVVEKVSVHVINLNEQMKEFQLESKD